MRIGYANITPQAHRNPPSPPVADRSTNRLQQQPAEARDRYEKNSRNENIIDAEFVEFYSPSAPVFTRERQNLDTSIEIDSKTPTDEKLTATATDRYQLRASEPPPRPGSFVDYYA